MGIVFDQTPGGMFAYAGRLAVELDENTGMIWLYVAGLRVLVNQVPEGSHEVIPVCAQTGCGLPLWPIRKGSHSVLAHKVGGEFYTACPDRLGGTAASGTPIAGRTVITVPTEETADVIELDGGRLLVGVPPVRLAAV